MDKKQNDLDLLCINTIRMLAVDAVEKANSGHPGMPMGAAPLAYILWTRFMRFSPGNPQWSNRDRFVLSAGHGSMLLYALLYLTGYDLSLDELKSFRQWGSKTPGHPEHGRTPGVDTTTGPLGQGFGNAVGMAMAERFLAEYFNRPGYQIVDHYTYVLASDGDLMEGLSHEAASLAGHLGLGKLICLYDDNRVSIEGSTDLAFTEDRGSRFEAYGWHVQTINDGNDLECLTAAIRKAREENSRPSIIAVRTSIGYGSPNKQDSAAAHGEPLGDDEVGLTKERLDWPVTPEFFVPDSALTYFRQAVEKGRKHETEWRSLFDVYTEAHPDLSAKWVQWMSGELPGGWEKNIPQFHSDAKGMATRAASGFVLNKVAPGLSNLLGGSADLAPSTKTMIKGAGDLSRDYPGGRNIHFGVREHGMGSILNGMALHGGLIPYGATFLVFSDYMRPSLRLASMMQLKVIYVFTHDSIGLGEDGPTHQPVEHLASLRAIPGLIVIRPADANETAEAWRYALSNDQGPTALILSRQNLPILEIHKDTPAEGLSRGAYILREATNQHPALILIASGSEVHLALNTAVKLETKGYATRVVSMPSWELYEKQPENYKKKVLPPEIPLRVAIEAGITQGWHRYVGDSGEVIAIDHFGASAPYLELYKNFGFTEEQVVDRVLKMLERADCNAVRKPQLGPVAVGVDHGGMPLKGVIIQYLKELGLEVLDLGTWSEAPVDYPDIARAVGHAVSRGDAHRGILICGSGIGACIAANKIPGVRAGLAHDSYSAHQGVEHDDINVLCLGARVIGSELALELVHSFLSAKFTGEERYKRRLEKVFLIEQGKDI